MALNTLGWETAGEAVSTLRRSHRPNITPPQDAWSRARDLTHTSTEQPTGGLNLAPHIHHPRTVDRRFRPLSAHYQLFPTPSGLALARSPLLETFAGGLLA